MNYQKYVVLKKGRIVRGTDFGVAMDAFVELKLKPDEILYLRVGEQHDPVTPKKSKR